jgi:hypothetical protein
MQPKNVITAATYPDPYPFLSNPDKILSLSFFRDEEAIAQWRQCEVHRDAQSKGRASIFKHYRLRIANVVRDYGLHDREQAPQDSRERHEISPTFD